MPNKKIVEKNMVYPPNGLLDSLSVWCFRVVFINMKAIHDPHTQVAPLHFFKQ